jgi:hypothetical protein
MSAQGVKRNSPRRNLVLLGIAHFGEGALRSLRNEYFVEPETRSRSSLGVMEVTLGTDNRYLHGPEQNGLTSEYMTAARLIGGLTRWEVLQIVKAGFKNAFLDKAEGRDVIRSVEKEIYRIVAADNV